MIKDEMYVRKALQEDNNKIISFYKLKNIKKKHVIYTLFP